jgi:ribosomal protein S18 acetylase RimI-like enzyme
MTPVTSLNQVQNAVQKAKTGASAFCTNFFPLQSKLQAWIDHQELWHQTHESVEFVLRKDRNFWHLYFSARSPEALAQALNGMPELKKERVVTDLVGNEASTAELIKMFEGAGLRPYTKLLRLARASQPLSPADSTAVVWADPAENSVILQLLEKEFDPYADQLPTAYELAAALTGRQIMAIRHDSKIAALLYFETQGFTSSIRYWVVAAEFRSYRYGSALIRHYLMTHTAVRRFLLWVAAKNENAIQKYQHYGYAPDGLVDHILVNDLIQP